jgi:predicted neuraminidase
MAALPQQVARHRVLLVQAAILLAAIPAVMRTARWWRTPQFAVPIIHGRSVTAPRFEEELLPEGTTPFVHAPSATELPNGDLIAVWYGGRNEMQSDVSIFASRYDRVAKTWSKPAVIITAAATASGIGAHVKSLGNPVIHASGDRLTLFYTAVVLGGWSGGTICMAQSADGFHWTPPRRIYGTPFFDISLLVKGRVVPYVDGSVALPYYQQLTRRWSGVMRITPDGTVVDNVRIDASYPLIQPWIVPGDFTHAVALMRWSSRQPGNVNIAWSSDGGRHWSAPQSSAVMHRDSAVAAVRLSDRSLFAVYNNTMQDRRDLAFVRSPDDGIHWSQPWSIERDREPEAWFTREYSYPFMLQTNDGMIHVFYTWRRLRIAHLSFNESWIFENAQLTGGVR